MDRRGSFNAVVVYKVDRLTRALADFVRIVAIFDAAEVSFVSITQAFNTTTSMGSLTLNVLLSFAQFEREVTAERIRDKIAASKARGIWMGGIVPIGYRLEARKLLPEPEEAAPDGVPVIGLARTPAKVTGLGIEVRPGDYDQPEQLRTSLAGVDALVIVSGMAPPEDRIQQHGNVIDAACAAGVKKLVYTSIIGPEEGTRFSPVVRSNRQTEAGIRASGLDWAIGRNGIYIEPDIEYLDGYKARGEIANSAGSGKCGYTTRSELAHAYAALLTRDDLNDGTFDLYGTPITQAELAGYLNQNFGTDLTYREMTPEAFVADRSADLGDFLGPIIGGIYEGIRQGIYDRPGEYADVTGRPHQSWQDYFSTLRT